MSRITEIPQLRPKKPAATWTPASLRWPFLTTLIAALCLSIVGLELVNWKIKQMGGLQLDNQAASNALRYVPTIFTIMVGVAWKGITSDFCMLTPWAAISGNWAKAKDSILLNYVDALDIVSVYTAFSHRHFMLALVIICGLLTGSSVALANALAREVIGAGIERSAKLLITEKFVYNGSLAVPLGWRSSLPRLEWQTYDNEDTEHGRFPWLTNTHVFPALNTQNYHANGTILNTVVDTFSASLVCTAVAYNTTYIQHGYNSSFVLEANSVANCSFPISQQIIWPFNSSSVLQYPPNNSSGLFDIPPISWSNITTCNAEDDYRLLATNVVLDIDKSANSPYIKDGHRTLYNSTNVWSSASVHATATGFLCTPHYWSIPASVAIDSTTGLVSTNFELLQNETQEIPSVGVGFDFLQAQLNNPYDASSIKVFEAAATNNQTSQHANSYDWYQFSGLKVMQKYAYLYLWNNAYTYNSSYSLRDPFMDTIARSSFSTIDLVNNATLFQQRLDLAFAQFMAALVSSTARTPQNTSAAGTAYTSTNYFLIRQDILHLLEAVLACLALVASLVLIFAKPRTYLTHHPGSLDQMSLLLANSPEADDVFEGLGQYDHRGLDRHLTDVYCRLSHSKDGNLQLQMIKAQLLRSSPDDHASSIELRPLYSQRPSPKSNALQTTIRIEPAGDSNANVNRHRPFALRTGSRAGILFSLGGMIGATIALYLVSKRRDGFNAESSSVPTAFSLVPTIILVIVGYCVASIQQAALTLATYSHLASNSARSGRAMVTRQIRDASRMLFDHFIDWSSVTIPCLALVIVFPVLKLMAAKLFYLSVGTFIVPAAFPVDISQIQVINNLSQWIPSSSAQSTAIAMGNYLSLQMGLSTQIYMWFDRVGSLNLPVISYNISSLLSGGPLTSQEDKFTARIMAMNTSTTCTAAKSGAFDLFATSCNSSTGYTFTFQCATDDCRTRFDLPLQVVNISRTVIPNHDDPSSYPYFGYSYPSLWDDSIDIMLANFSGLNSSKLDFTKIACDNKPINKSLFGDSVPTITAVNCTRNLNLVYANVTFARLYTGADGTISSDNGKSTNGDTVQEFRTTKTAQLFAAQQQSDWLTYSYDLDRLYHVGNELGPNLYPSNFLSLLTQQQDIATGDQLNLLRPSVLEDTTAQIYRNWTQTALQYAIGLIYAGQYSGSIPANAIPPAQLQNLTYSYFTLYHHVVRQDLGFTIALISLLGLALVCVSMVSLLIPRSTLLPKAPSSIAAQLSMLVDSRVISILRTNSGGKDFFKDNRFGLGWWSTVAPPYAASDRAAISSLRWGIDVGVLDAERRGLRAPAKTDARGTGYEALTEEEQTPSASAPASVTQRIRLNTRIDDPAVSTSTYSPLRDRSDEEDMLRLRFDFENRV